MSIASSPHARLIGFLCLGVTATGWAMNWPIIKILLRDWPPLFARGVAGTAAGIILAGIAIGYGERLHVPRHAIARLLFASFTNVFAWMGGATVALKMLSIGEGALLVYTMPIWATLFAWPILGHRPGLRDAVALVLGIAGIAVLMGEHGFALSQDKMVGIALTLSSATLFALGSVLMRTPLPIPMGVCYLTWFATLRRLPPSTAAMGTLVVPVMGVIGAAVVLGEPLGLREVTAMALTLGGVTLALRKPAAT
jgi:drug/metabolite transporter (DMT)-like permease